MNERIEKLIEQCTVQEFSDCTGGFETFDKDKFARLIVQQCIWAFGETRTEPSLEKYILDRLGINHE
jgi:hypothetical protein